MNNLYTTMQRVNRLTTLAYALESVAKELEQLDCEYDATRVRQAARSINYEAEYIFENRPSSPVDLTKIFPEGVKA